MATDRFILPRRIVEGILACVLLTAAAMKTYHLWRNAPYLMPTILNDRTVLAFVVEAELVLACWLAVGAFDRARFFCTIGCFALFSVVATWESIHALPSCGCFGEIRIPPGFIACFDVAAVIALWLTRPRGTSVRLPRHLNARLIGGAVVVALASGILWTGFFLNKAAATANDSLHKDRQVVILAADTWRNQTFPLLDAIEGGAALRRGRWCVMLYHYDCPTCIKAIPLYLQMAATGDHAPGRLRIGFIAIPPFGEESADPVPDSPDYLRLRLPADRDWFVMTPTVVTLEDGKVLTVAQGDEALKPPP